MRPRRPPRHGTAEEPSLAKSRSSLGKSRPCQVARSVASRARRRDWLSEGRAGKSARASRGPWLLALACQMHALRKPGSDAARRGGRAGSAEIKGRRSVELETGGGFISRSRSHRRIELLALPSLPTALRHLLARHRAEPATRPAPRHLDRFDTPPLHHHAAPSPAQEHRQPQGGEARASTLATAHTAARTPSSCTSLVPSADQARAGGAGGGRPARAREEAPRAQVADGVELAPLGVGLARRQRHARPERAPRTRPRHQGLLRARLGADRGDDPDGSRAARDAARRQRGRRRGRGGGRGRAPAPPPLGARVALGPRDRPRRRPRDERRPRAPPVRHGRLRQARPPRPLHRRV